MALGNKEIIDLGLVPDSANVQLYGVKADTDYRLGVGQANGVAQLDATGKVPAAQLPALAAVWGTITGTLTSQTDLALAIGAKADLVSPVFTGAPTAPTAAVNTNTAQLATTAYVVSQIADDAPTKVGGGASGTWGISITGSAASAGVASTANAWTTARNITLNGDVSGVVAMNGTADVVMTTAVADNSHFHVAANISDSTATGRAVLTAAAPANARVALEIYVQSGDPGAVPDGSVWLW